MSSPAPVTELAGSLRTVSLVRLARPPCARDPGPAPDEPGGDPITNGPATTLAARDQLLIFASGKNRANPAGELHTNFTLPRENGYLALIKPDGVTKVTEYKHHSEPAQSNYPQQTTDVSYGFEGSTVTATLIQGGTVVALGSDAGWCALFRLADVARAEAAPGEPSHEVSRLYYLAWTRQALARYAAAFDNDGPETNAEDIEAPAEYSVAAYVDASPYWQRVWRAVGAHPRRARARRGIRSPRRARSRPGSCRPARSRSPR